jgi:hypothetical protein
MDDASSIEDDFERFVQFATDYTDSLKSNWWEIDSPHERIRLKELVYLDGLAISREGKVLTPTLSPIYRYKTTKKTSIDVSSANLISFGGPAGT